MGKKKMRKNAQKQAENGQKNAKNVRFLAKNRTFVHFFAPLFSATEGTEIVKNSVKLKAKNLKP